MDPNRIYLKAMYLQDFMGYEGETLVPLSSGCNIIQGECDSGKSVLNKMLKVFTGVYGRDDYTGLIHGLEGSKKLQARCGIYLSNRTKLFATIMPNKATFYLTDWSESTILREWQQYDDSIRDYLHWAAVPEERLTLNILKSANKPFIDTSPTTNAIILQTLKTIPELDRKIQNLKDQLKTSTEVKKSARESLAIVDNNIYKEYQDVSYQVFVTDNLEGYIRKAETIDLLREFLVNQLVWRYGYYVAYYCENLLQTKLVKEFLKQKLECNIYKSKVECLEKQLTINSISSYLNNTYNSSIQKGIVEVLDHSNQCQKIKSFIDKKLVENNTKDCFTKIEDSANKLKIIITLKQYLSNLQQSKQIKTLLDKADKVATLNKVRQDTESLKTLLGAIYEYRINDLQYSKLILNKRSIEISKLKLLLNRYTCNRSQLGLLNRHMVLSNLKTQLLRLEDLNNIQKQITTLEEEKSEFKVCPLCGKSLDHTH